MKPKRYLRSSVALTLSVAMLLPMMFGCKNESEKNSGAAAEAAASFVTWSKSGQFTTTLSAKDIDFSDVEMSDISVEAFRTVSQSPEESQNGDTLGNSDQQDEETKSEKVSYPVKKIKQKDNALEITFEDKNASEKEVDSYTLEIDKKNIVTPVVVDYPTPTL